MTRPLSTIYPIAICEGCRVAFLRPVERHKAGRRFCSDQCCRRNDWKRTNARRRTETAKDREARAR